LGSMERRTKESREEQRRGSREIIAENGREEV
jgi:hypothetical protein